MWSRQAEIARAIAVHPRVSVRSGHKVGKSLTAAIIGWWWLLTRPGARVIMTAPTARQVRSVLWREVRDLNRKARWPLGGDIHKSPDSGVILPDGRDMVGFSTDEPERMAGISGRNVLFIVDEASGVPQAIFEAIEGNRAGGARVCMFSNPTKTSGEFYDSHNSKRGFYHTVHISSEESPNVIGGQPIVPGLAMPEFIAEKKREWGVDSPLFAVRIAGNFPAEAFNTVIGLAILEEALERHRGFAELDDDGRDQWPDPLQLGRLHIGVDVARFGDDDSVIQPRRGIRAYPQIRIHGADTIQVAGKVMEVVNEMALPHEMPVVNIDAIGWGAGVYDQLKSCERIEAYPIQVSERAYDQNAYPNIRTELWFWMKNWLKNGGCIPEDGELEGELVAPTYDFDGDRRQRVERKHEIKRRLHRSPDGADALGLSLAKPPAITDDYDFEGNRLQSADTGGY